MSYIYLASPYTHPDPGVMHERYISAAEYCARLLQEERFIYSPIVHCHDLAQRFALPRDINFWHSYNTTMLRLAREMHILTLPGWERSHGVQYEIDVASTIQLPLSYISWRDLAP